MAEHQPKKQLPTSSSPGERTVRFILDFCKWLKAFVHFLLYASGSRSQSRTIRHRAAPLSRDTPLRYPSIMVVEDNDKIASQITTTIQEHYREGEVLIHLAPTFKKAVFFFDHSKINLVIMDNDLDDEKGDGVQLTRKFKTASPETIILANSSSQRSNTKLLAAGATLAVNKKKTGPEPMAQGQRSTPGAGRRIIIVTESGIFRQAPRTTDQGGHPCNPTRSFFSSSPPTIKSSPMPC